MNNDKIDLYIDIFEYETEGFRDFMKRRNLKPDIFDEDEDLLTIYLNKEDIDIECIFELEDVLDKRIIVSSIYLGSVETIQSLGLD